MLGIPPDIMKRLRVVLSACSQLESDKALRAMFVDSRLSPWRYSVNEAPNVWTRVDFLISDLESKAHTAFKQNALILFLQVVYEHTPEGDALREQLGDLAVELAQALSYAPPPLALDNIRRSHALFQQLPDPSESNFDPSAEIATTRPVVSGTSPREISPRIFTQKLEALRKPGQPEWLDIGFLQSGVRAARAVCRLEWSKQGQGTGFLVGPDLIITNYHVLCLFPTDDLVTRLRQCEVRFGAHLLPDGGVAGGKLVILHATAALVAHSPSEQLDYALLRLEKRMTDGAAMTYVVLSPEAARRDQAANIIQHPNGGPMKVALRRNEIVHVTPERLYYAADTDEGSSGSPVFDDDWRVIALHRSATVLDTASNRRIPGANEGVPMSAIEREIRSYLTGG